MQKETKSSIARKYRAQYIKLDQEVIDRLACPLCKSQLAQKLDGFICVECSTSYPVTKVNVGEHEERVFDFRISWPSYAVPDTHNRWMERQKHFESKRWKVAPHDDLNEYLAQIKGVQEIYEQDFQISGEILDVGGYDGRLRHFMADDKVPLYVSVDPFLDAFKDIQQNQNLLKAYPSLNEPCNFLLAQAEHLPFLSGSFDWVHMRSVIDHFADPFLALKEAHRVLKVDGRIMIGLLIAEKLYNLSAPLDEKKKVDLLTRIKVKTKREGLGWLFRSAQSRFAKLFQPEGEDALDHHFFRFTYAELMDLLSMSGFFVEKYVWQKPPHAFVIYLSASAEKIG